MYAIEAESYSGYRVHAVCESKKIANAWVKAMNTSGDYKHYSVVPLPLVTASDRIRKVTTYEYHAVLWDDGRITGQTRTAHSDWSIDALYGTPPRRPHIRFVHAPVCKGDGGRLEITGASRSAVDKVFSDQIAQWNAGLWKTDKEINP